MVMLSDFKHLRDVCMSYSEHMRHSHRLGVLFIKAGLKAFIHGIWPAAFVSSSSDTLEVAGELMRLSGCHDGRGAGGGAGGGEVDFIPDVKNFVIQPVFGPLASPTIRRVMLDADGVVVDRGMGAFYG